jgi:hypothetical protein
MKGSVRPDGNPLELCDGRRGDLALLAGLLLFIVWLAGLSNKATKCYDIYFAQGVGGLNKGSNVTFSGVPVGQVRRSRCLPDRPEFVWVRIEVDEQTPCSRAPARRSRASASPASAKSSSTAPSRRPPI